MYHETRTQGPLYDGQESVPENTKKAIHWLTLAAENGDAQSQCALGVHYVRGHGVKKDVRVGAQLYRCAATQNDEWACYLLGLCYRDGTGVKRNRRLAMHWFRIAADKGVKEGRRAIQKMKTDDF